MEKRNIHWNVVMERKAFIALMALVVALGIALGVAIGYLVVGRAYSNRLFELEAQYSMMNDQLPFLANEAWLLEKELVEKGIIAEEALTPSRNVMFGEIDAFSISHYITEMLLEVKGVP